MMNMIFKSMMSSIVLLMLSANLLAGTAQKSDKVTATTTEKTPVVSVHAGRTSKTKDDWTLYAEQWDIARSGETVLSLQVLNKVVNAWLQEKDKTIEVQYPGGEEGEFWVQELTDWLVSLGVPSSSIRAVPGSAADDIISFRLSRR